MRIPRFVAVAIGTLALTAALPLASASAATTMPSEHCGLLGLSECGNSAWQAALERDQRAHLQEQRLQTAYFDALAAQNSCGCNPTQTYVIQQQYVAAQSACGVADRQFFALRRRF